MLSQGQSQMYILTAINADMFRNVNQSKETTTLTFTNRPIQSTSISSTNKV